MKDKKCKAYFNTYKCNSNSCDGCQYRFAKNDVIAKLEKIAIQTDCPVYKGDIIDDYYIRLSDVIDVIKAERRWQG